MATERTSGALRALTILNALVYFGASAYHSGLLVPAGALAPASIAEALLGLVLVTALSGVISPRIAYGIVFAGRSSGSASSSLAVFSVSTYGSTWSCWRVWRRGSGSSSVDAPRDRPRHPRRDRHHR
jgi:hypothetical protein